MRIAVVTTSYPRSPADPSGHFVATEVRALRAAGNEVTVLAPKAGPRSAFGAPGAVANLRAHPLRAASVVQFVHDTRIWIQRAVAEHSLDSIEAHWALPCAWPIAMTDPSTDRDALPTLHVTSHGSDARLLAALPGPVRRRVAARIAAACTSWRFVSAELLEDFLRSLDRGTRTQVERRALVKPGAIEFPDVAARAKQLRRDHATFSVVVGRLVSSKRVDAVIRHVAIAAPSETLFVIGEGPERERLHRLARDVGIDGRFLGAVARSETLAWIAAAQCLYFASNHEGCSTVLREAERLGTSVRHVT